jgi:hypothetical protein
VGVISFVHRKSVDFCCKHLQAVTFKELKMVNTIASLFRKLSSMLSRPVGSSGAQCLKCAPPIFIVFKSKQMLGIIVCYSNNISVYI